MSFDLVIIGLLILGFLGGWKKGLLSIVSGTVGLVLQIYAAVFYNQWLRQTLDSYFSLTARWAEFFSAYAPVSTIFSASSSVPNLLAQGLLYVSSFLILFFGVKFLLRALNSLLTGGLDGTFIGPLNRFLGGVFGLIFTSAILGMIVVFISEFFYRYPIPDDTALGDFGQVLEKSQIVSFLARFFTTLMAPSG